ncbi:di-trans,poly-cis-decaprenylcistransferase [Candidatus Bathyarchaeota archaeon]|nr:MAG: di-trans,poly-cis-decaprenylcistransferase [Candidatus Bathyarchaeota archaeon]
MRLLYKIYEWRLERQVLKNREKIPRHVAIILDGNRRFAKERNLDPWEGHKLGLQKLEEVLEWLWNLGVRIVTVYAFSKENFHRSEREVRELMNLIKDGFIRIRRDERIKKYEIKVKAIGDLEELPEDVRAEIRKTEEFTREFNGGVLNVAVSYSGRSEIVNAVREIVKDYSKGKISLDEINEDTFSRYLYTARLPDPDLVIRTSGEERLSGFLLWQSAYSELYFCETNWPEFRRIDLLRAIRTYQGRERRFGR